MEMRKLIYLVSLKSALRRSILHYSQRLLFWHKIIQGLLPSYLWKYSNDVREEVYLTQSTTQNKVNPIPARTKVFINSLNSLIPSCIKEKCKLNEKIRNRKSINKLKATIFNFIRPKWSSVFDINDTNGSNLLGSSKVNFLLFQWRLVLALLQRHVRSHCQMWSWTRDIKSLPLAW